MITNGYHYNSFTMSLQIKYSKEIAKELGKVAVYLPGELIEVGDIITFPNGKGGIFSKEAPLGVFTKISSLNNLNVEYSTQSKPEAKHSYKFSSESSVSRSSSINSEVGLSSNALPNADIEVVLQFTSEGSIYFHALDCYKTQINDIASLENEIISKSQVLIWENTYLVTSVTYASKALIMQSRSKNSEITLSGNVNGIKTSGANIGTDAEFNIKSQNGDFFIKDWSNNVSIFMELMKFDKQIFQAINRNLNPKQIQGRLTPVDINSLLI
ncbi:hypothetical protein SAMN05421841_1966 [Chryseobacterium wanjuense]|uniref:Uncharacterized protein n=2 Tax=Chryseobacterium wanjuense TaxID=356305 RepID=A0A1I0QK31_9FLAO|nr:hypothetical protein SAMN05421841_1966 [Chryseobacterium wanjuense]